MLVGGAGGLVGVLDGRGEAGGTGVLAGWGVEVGRNSTAVAGAEVGCGTGVLVALGATVGTVDVGKTSASSVADTVAVGGLVALAVVVGLVG